jgi:hypothetical protein
MMVGRARVRAEGDVMLDKHDGQYRAGPAITLKRDC